MALSSAERVAKHREKQSRYIEADTLAKLMAADESARRKETPSRAAERQARSVRYHRWLADGQP